SSWRSVRWSRERPSRWASPRRLAPAMRDSRRRGTGGGLTAVRAALTLAATLGVLWLSGGSNTVVAAGTLPSLALLAGIAALPPLALALWRHATPRRRVSVEGEAAR
ncbi:hypothetical protein, partial [Azospirillum argentinense]|uniref:hypothetical protein n=1 Tax=Azospirillum argentinense TaxID=2970906 RepID=UPI001B3BDBBD